MRPSVYCPLSLLLRRSRSSLVTRRWCNTAATTVPAATDIRSGSSFRERCFDSERAFNSKSNSELIQTYVVLRFCSFKPLVDRARSVYRFSTRVIGERITHFVLRKTFFAHFCGGENYQDILPTVDYLRHRNIGSILDYAAESDVDEEVVERPSDTAQADSLPPGHHEEAQRFQVQSSFVDRRHGVHSARIYFYEGEEKCDINMYISLRAIAAAAQRERGFAAVKVTALGKPELLMRISQVLVEVRKVFDHFVKQQLSYKDRNECYITRENMLTGLHAMGLTAVNEHAVDTLFQLADTQRDGRVDYLEWIEFLRPERPFSTPFFSSQIIDTEAHSPVQKTAVVLPRLSVQETIEMKSMVRRLIKLAEAAADQGVSLMVDAEHTYFQGAIDHLVVNLQRQFNRNGVSTIYNTYQCYLTDSFSRVKVDLERAQREGFVFAAKIVRGAYMIQERARAASVGYEDPIWPDIQATHYNYDRIADAVLKAPARTSLMVATHNINSIQVVCSLMKQYGIAPSAHNVYFGQLLGMCDHVSLTLGMDGYNVFKYVPYGPLREVIPYLIRRAEENTDVLGSAQDELQLVKNELRRRLGLKHRAIGADPR